MVEDIMPTFRQKIRLNNEELSYFQKEVGSWTENCKLRKDDINEMSSDDEAESELVKEGKRCVRNGEFSRAISYFTSAISKNPNVPGYYVKRAKVFMRKNDLIAAERDCSQAIALDGDHLEAYYFRANARKMLGKCREACEDFKRVMNEEPDNDDVAAEYDDLVDYVRKTLTQAGERNEADIVALSEELKERGNILIGKGDHKGAKEKFTQAIRLNQNEPVFYANRAVCHMKLRDFTSAEVDCTRALQLDDNYVKVYVRRARVRRHLGKLSEAKGDLTRAFELRPDEEILNELRELDDKSAERLRAQTGNLEVRNDAIKNENTQFEAPEGGLTKPENPNDNSTVRNNLETHLLPLVPSPTFECNDFLLEELSPPKTPCQTRGNNPFIKILVQDAKFAVPEQLLEIPKSILEKFNLVRDEKKFS